MATKQKYEITLKMLYNELNWRWWRWWRQTEIEKSPSEENRSIEITRLKGYEARINLGETFSDTLRKKSCTYEIDHFPSHSTWYPTFT